MLTEINVMGVYVAPIVIYALLTVPIFLICRWVLGMIGLWRFVWHPALFEVGLFISILSLVVLW
jgi:hypothetical protein